MSQGHPVATFASKKCIVLYLHVISCIFVNVLIYSYPRPVDTRPSKKAKASPLDLLDPDEKSQQFLSRLRDFVPLAALTVEGLMSHIDGVVREGVPDGLRIQS